MEQRLVSFCNELDSLKEALEAHITDKTISLDARWETWKHVPACLKNQSIYYYEMYLGDVELLPLYSIDVERYQTVGVADVLSNVLIRIASGTVSISGWDSSDLNELKEKILADNVGSFINDW